MSTPNGEDEAGAEHRSSFIDVTSFSIANRDDWQHEEVAESLRAVLAQLEESLKSISGWSSAPADVP